jgi:hypothetical protein
MKLFLANLNMTRRKKQIQQMIQTNNAFSISNSFSFIRIAMLNKMLVHPNLINKVYIPYSISQLFRYHALYQKYISSQPQPEKSDDAEQEA